jgi:hypothetical protein
MSTVGTQGPEIGPPTCGTGPGLTAGQTCISPSLAAGFPIINSENWGLIKEEYLIFTPKNRQKFRDYKQKRQNLSKNN